MHDQAFPGLLEAITLRMQRILCTISQVDGKARETKCMINTTVDSCSKLESNREVGGLEGS